jgi:predicted dienelactone hydrolase
MKTVLFRAKRLLAAAVPLVWLALGGTVRAQDYDPLVVNPSFHPSHVDLTLHDAARHRDIPLRVYLPGQSRPAPLILFSHGLGGSRAGSKFLGEHWAARGYVAVFLQHPGSDDSVWKEEPLGNRLAALRQAAKAVSKNS